MGKSTPGKPGNPRPPRGEVRRKLIEAHREEKVEARAADTEVQVVAYLVNSTDGAGMSAAPLWTVHCPIEGYEHLRPVYNLGIPFRKRRLMPRLVGRIEGESEDAYNERYEEWLLKLPQWMGLFLVRIDGWDLKDVDGRPLPAPGGGDYSAYAYLWEVNEALATWLGFDGYSSALVASVKNSEARSLTPSS